MWCALEALQHMSGNPLQRPSTIPLCLNRLRRTLHLRQQTELAGDAGRCPFARAWQ